MASDEIKLMLFAGELSTQDNLKHLHPELVAQIVKQVWPAAYTQGRADALKELERVLQEEIRSNENTANSLDNSSDATGDLSYSIEASVLDGINSYLKKLIAKIKLPGGEND